MKYRERIQFDQQAMTDKTVVSVLLTCGITSRFPEFENTKYKALLPLKGRPIVDYVSIALCNSQVEQVFVVHEPDEDLGKLLTSHEKIILVNCGRSKPTLTDSVMCVMERLFEYYGEKELHQRHIMFVPCDIPLVKTRDINALIGQTLNTDADYCVTVVRSRLLKEEYPWRHFRTLYFNELGGNCSLQPIVFIRSGLFRKAKVIGDLHRIEVCDNSGRPLDKLLKTVDDVREHRHSLTGWARFVFRIAGKGHTTLFLQLLFDLLRNRVTESKFREAVYLTLNVRLAAIESKSVTFSADIDNPADLDNLSRFTILKTENEPVIALDFNNSLESDAINGTGYGSI
jgi:CTP:molybdopterin cytidylyltransferase MocA